MSTFQPVMIKLSGERGHQLKQFAAREGISVTAAIGVMLRAVKATDTIPGFDFGRFSPEYDDHYLIFDGFRVVLDARNWRDIADEIERVANQAGTGARKIDLPSGEDIILARGTGTTFLIKAHNPFTGQTVAKELSHDLARDLAVMIRTAVTA